MVYKIALLTGAYYVVFVGLEFTCATPSERKSIFPHDHIPTKLAFESGKEDGQQNPDLNSKFDNEITNYMDSTTVESFPSENMLTAQNDESDMSSNSGTTVPETETSSAAPAPVPDTPTQPEILPDGVRRAVCQCGKIPFRIPIGQDANVNARPWTAAVVREGIVKDGKPHCAGVLINDRYVLTSASCMDGVNSNEVQIWLTASTSLHDSSTSGGTTKVNVLDVIMHPNYNADTKENDLCLVRMNHPVYITSNVFSPVCVPSAGSSSYAGRYGTIFAWSNGRSNRICTAEVPILENSVCKRDSKHSGSITGNMICAGYLAPYVPIRTNDCVGDPGAPLTVVNRGKASLVGITSWGFENQNKEHTPTVYTRVSGYADWILHNTEDAYWCAM